MIAFISSGGFSSSQRLHAALENMVLLGIENDVEVVGIRFPLSAVFIEEIKDTPLDTKKAASKLDLKVYDYKYLYVDRDAFFKDQDHLNNAGVEDFIIRLSKDVL